MAAVVSVNGGSTVYEDGEYKMLLAGELDAPADILRWVIRKHVAEMEEVRGEVKRMVKERNGKKEGKEGKKEEQKPLGAPWAHEEGKEVKEEEEKRMVPRDREGGK